MCRWCFDAFAISLRSAYKVTTFYLVVLFCQRTSRLLFFATAIPIFRMDRRVCVWVCWIENDFTDFPFTAKSIRYTGASSITCTINTHSHTERDSRTESTHANRLSIGTCQFCEMVKCFDVKLNKHRVLNKSCPASGWSFFSLSILLFSPLIGNW